MAATEAARHALYRRLEQMLGTDETSTLMELLPPTGFDDVAREADLVLLRSDVEQLRADVRAEFADVRTEIADVRTEIAELRAEVADGQRRLTLTLLSAMIAINGAMAAAVVGLLS